MLLSWHDFSFMFFKYRKQFADHTFKCILFNENDCILTKTSSKCVHKGPIGNQNVKINTPTYAYTALSQYLYQCWLIVNWTIRNKLQWNLYSDIIFIQENAFENVVREMAPICLGLNILKQEIELFKMRLDRPWTESLVFKYSENDLMDRVSRCVHAVRIDAD